MLIDSGIVDEEKALNLAKELGIIKGKKESIKESTNQSNNDITSIKLPIKVNNKVVGEIHINTSQKNMGSDTLEITQFFFTEKVDLIPVSRNAINDLWVKFPTHNKIVANPNKDSNNFWEKIGFERLNNEFLIKLRGH